VILPKAAAKTVEFEGRPYTLLRRIPATLNFNDFTITSAGKQKTILKNTNGRVLSFSKEAA
jgi:hypothetical protein